MSRVPDNITKENIDMYIKKRVKTGKVEVKKLETRTTRQDNQSFLVGVVPELKEQVYENSFWPAKIRFERFNFKLGEHFLDNLKKDTINSENNNAQKPSSFL